MTLGGSQQEIPLQGEVALAIGTGGSAHHIHWLCLAAILMKGIEHLASKLEMSFSDKLMWWIKKQKRKPADVYGAVGISKGLFAKIRNNSQYHPTKETVLAFVVALHLSTEDAADLLRRAGYALSPSSLGDMIVAYFLNAKRYNIDEVNEALYTHDCKTLTNWRDCK